MARTANIGDRCELLLLGAWIPGRITAKDGPNGFGSFKYDAVTDYGDEVRGLRFEQHKIRIPQTNKGELK